MIAWKDSSLKWPRNVSSGMLNHTHSLTHTCFSFLLSPLHPWPSYRVRMTYYVSSGTLNPTHSLTPTVCSEANLQVSTAKAFAVFSVSIDGGWCHWSCTFTMQFLVPNLWGGRMVFIVYPPHSCCIYRVVLLSWGMVEQFCQIRVTVFVALTNAVVTCEIKLFQHLSMSDWNNYILARGNYVILFRNYFRSLLQLMNIFNMSSITEVILK